MVPDFNAFNLIVIIVVILHAELQVNGHATPLAKVEFALMQATDYLGRPSSTVRIQPLRLTFTGQAVALAFFAQWGLDSFLRRSGRVVFYGEQNQVLRTITFYEAHCVLYHAALHPDVQGQAALTLTLALSPAAIDHQGQHVESHSLLPWAAPAATRRRVLTSPADLLPSPSLRASAQAAADAQAVQHDQPVGARLFSARGQFEGNERALATKPCHASQVKALTEALEGLKDCLDARSKSLARWEEEDQEAFDNAFGRTSEQDRVLIQTRVEKMSALVDKYLAEGYPKASFLSSEAAFDADGNEADAYIHEGDATHKVYLCPPFWRAPSKGDDSKLQILAHELSHFTDIGPTKDHKYGLDDCAYSAFYEPDEALENADNFAYYVGDTTLP